MEVINKDYCSKCKTEDVPLIPYSCTVYGNKKTCYQRCRPCMAEVQRLKYKKNPQMIKRIVKRFEKNNPEKLKAWKSLAHQVKKGTIVRPDSCQDCGQSEKRIVGHHEDYSKPLEVEWLCDACHNKRHLH